MILNKREKKILILRYIYKKKWNEIIKQIKKLPPNVKIPNRHKIFIKKIGERKIMSRSRLMFLAKNAIIKISNASINDMDKCELKIFNLLKLLKK